MKTFAFWVTTAIVLSVFGIASSQEAQTVFGEDTQFSSAWGLGMKINSIQEKTGTLLTFYVGTLIDRSVMVAFTGGLNLGHPKVNYGYLGVLGEYTFKPKKLVHYGAQLLLAAGSTKDYEREKSSLFDNYGNISGPGFYLIEPALNAELNLNAKTRLTLGLGYRYVTGLDEDHELIASTKVTNEDLSGINLILSVKFALY